MWARLRSYASEFSRFLAVGGVATAVQYVLLMVLVTGAGTRPQIASTIGFVVSAGLNYALNYTFTFASSRAHTSALMRFAIVASCGAAVNFGAMATLVGVVHVHYLLAQIVSTAVVAVWNYVANRNWTFGAAKERPKWRERVASLGGGRW